MASLKGKVDGQARLMLALAIENKTLNSSHLLFVFKNIYPCQDSASLFLCQIKQQ